MAFCSNCGAQLQGDAKFCGNCGKAAAAAQPTVEPAAATSPATAEPVAVAQPAATVEPAAATSPATAEPVAVAQPPATESAPAAQPAAAVEPAATSPAAAEPVAVAQPPATESAPAAQPAAAEAAHVAEQAETTAASAEQAGLENEGGILRKWWARNKNIIAVAAVFLAIVLFMIIFGLVSGGGATAQYTTNSGSTSAQTTQTQAHQTKTPADFGASGYYEKIVIYNDEHVGIAFLYNTYRQHNGNGRPLIDAFEKYLRSLGYIRIGPGVDFGDFEWEYSESEFDSKRPRYAAIMREYDSDVMFYLYSSLVLEYIDHDKRNRSYTYISRVYKETY